MRVRTTRLRWGVKIYLDYYQCPRFHRFMLLCDASMNASLGTRLPESLKDVQSANASAAANPNASVILSIARDTGITSPAFIATRKTASNATVITPARIAKFLHRLAHRTVQCLTLAIGVLPGSVRARYGTRKTPIRVNLPFREPRSHVRRIPRLPVSRVSRCFMLPFAFR